jgi:uncharacterized membrane protein YraQ (UPF0718 family)
MTPARTSSLRPAVGLVLGLVGLGIILAGRLSAGDRTAGALPDASQDVLTLAFSVLIESLPFIILGITLSILVQVWLPEKLLFRILPKNSFGRRAVISMLGMFLPVCECGNVPLARGLVNRGYSVSDSMTFLLAAPILNPVTIITTHQAFGFDDHILVARLIGGFVIANLLGWLFSLHPQPMSLLTPAFEKSCQVTPGQVKPGKVQQSVDLFVRESSVLMPALIIGSLVAGLIQVVIRRDTLVQLGSDPLWSVLAMMILAFVISICANVDAFFILPFATTFLPGSIVAFLVLGPVIDIKMLALLRTTYKTGTLVQISVLVALITMALGTVVNLIA